MEEGFETRFPQYLSSPIQVLWFESDELGVILFAVTIASICKGWSWLLVIAIPFLYSHYKFKYPRGFFKHMLYISGLKELHGYPTIFHKEFLE